MKNICDGGRANCDLFAVLAILLGASRHVTSSYHCKKMSTFKLDDVVALLNARVAALPVSQVETDAGHIGVQLERVVAAAKNAQAMVDATQRCRALFLRVMERVLRDYRRLLGVRNDADIATARQLAESIVFRLAVHVSNQEGRRVHKADVAVVQVGELLVRFERQYSHDDDVLESVLLVKTSAADDVFDHVSPNLFAEHRRGDWIDLEDNGVYLSGTQRLVVLIALACAIENVEEQILEQDHPLEEIEWVFDDEVAQQLLAGDDADDDATKDDEDDDAPVKSRRIQ